MQNAPQPNLQPDELSVIRHVVMDFLAARTELPGFEFDDLFQECAIHWWRQRPRYDTRRGASLFTYLHKVVKAKLHDIDRHHQSHGRGGRQPAVSLDALLLSPGQPTRLANLSSGDAQQHLDLDRAMKQLTERQRTIVSGLYAGLDKSEIAQRLEVSRDTLHRDLARIRQIFRDEGLAGHFH